MAGFEDKIIKVLKRSGRTALTVKKLMASASIKKEDLGKVQECISRLKERGEVFEQDKKLALSENFGLVPAVVDSVRGAFGFAIGISDQTRYFIPGKQMLGALPGDTVLIKPTESFGESPEGKIVFITHQADFRFAAEVNIDKSGIFVCPDSFAKFSFPARGKNGVLKDGDKVLARIYHRGKSHFDHRAEILKVFGSSDSAQVCAAAILEENGISDKFPSDVLEEAKTLSHSPIHPKEIKSRLDLRNEKIFTIDSADSKDLDDAVSVRKTVGGWVLGVHIADVSFYVRPKTALDNCAYERGTSIYYADRVVPMLPKELSNGICSLNPGEERLTLSAIISLDRMGNIKSYRFEKSVIRSAVKGVYSEINSILDKTADAKTKEKYRPLMHTIKLMEELSDILLARRNERGCPEISSSESKFVIDKNGKTENVLPRVQGKSEKMIEEFMITANRCAAMFAANAKLPFIYRIHERPALEKLAGFAEVLKKLGFNSKGICENVSPAKLSQILEETGKTKYKNIVNNLMLRSMAKAKYSEKNKGHFGLALEYYSHFTSPIRRYPDLAIHRIISSALDGGTPENMKRRYSGFVKNAAAQSSFCEETAMHVERSCEDRYKAEYMLSQIGKRFVGTISSVTANGIYVQLPNTVEGMIKVEELIKGEAILDEFISLKGSLSSDIYRIGDRIEIEVAGANVSQGTVDFVMIGKNVEI